MTTTVGGTPAAVAATHIYPFDHPHGRPAQDLAGLLGGKGAGLAEMTTTLGIDVPPGFTVAVPTCLAFRESGWPEGLTDELRAHVGLLGERMGRSLGEPRDPLLLAVRSGAPVSMPGMLDTVLNLGLNDQAVEGLAETSGDERFAWDSYRRFIQMFATTVMGVPHEALPRLPEDASVAQLRRHVQDQQQAVLAAVGRAVPQDPYVQLREAVEAVFRSWDSPRAKAYRAKEGIDPSLGTAVNVQAMVFGNRGATSGTGVVFTRCPSTGAPHLFGDYLPDAQGEDVVAGTARCLPIEQLRELQPAVYDELAAVLRRLEVHYRDVCDVEFTVEQGRLWLLQTRVGKRGAVAAVAVAVDLVDDPDIRLTREEALERVPPEVRARAREEVLARAGTAGADADLLAVGTGASPGRVTAPVVFDSEQAADAEGDVILVRSETSPEDVAGMAASVGILTTRGGLVSHAAVVARGWGIPAVVGASGLVVDGQQAVVSATGLRLVPGDVITIDGASGHVWRGAVERGGASGSVDDVLPQLRVLEEWDAQAGAVRV